MAADVVQGLAGGQEGIDRLAPFALTLLPALLRLMPAPTGLSKAALTALINLSQVSTPVRTKRVMYFNRLHVVLGASNTGH